MTANLRSTTEIYLLGHEYCQIIGAKLPSKKQVLCLFFYNHRTVKLTIRESAALTIQEVSIFWAKARIPVKKEQHSIEKLEQLHDEWKNLLKNKNKPLKVYREREIAFTSKLDDIFDIAHTNALSMMTSEDDKRFLLSQREKGRPGYLAGVRQYEIEKEKRRSERLMAEENRKRRHLEEKRKSIPIDSQTLFSSSESDSERTSDNDMSFENIDLPVISAEGASIGSKCFITPRILSALDKWKITDRAAMHLISAVAESLGHSIDDLVLSRTTLKRLRETNRVEIAESIKSTFKFTTGVVHWDGKLLPELSGTETVDRLPVIISHIDGEQLLGVPKISRATGLEMAEAVFQSLIDWRIVDNVVAACFDTTYSNTGRLNGAAIILEQKLDRSLLYLPCRHHICEITLRAAFESKMGNTSGVNVPLFVRFKNDWNSLNKNNFKAGIDDPNVHIQLNDVKAELAGFCNNELAKEHARDDYKELLEITLIFLGMIPTENVHFRLPGPMHHARWMSKAIYVLKVFIFREEFKLTAQEQKNLRDICIFVVRFYVKIWFHCTKAAKAPQLDFNYLRDIYLYKTHDEKLAMAVLNKICGQLWYLSDESIAFSFFDENVSSAEKRRMVQQLDMKRDVEAESIKRVELKIDDVKTFITKQLADFVTPNTGDLFKRFNISTDFLNKDPDMWPRDDNFKNGMKIISQIKVVNDIAERGVKLIQDYNKKLTRNEDDMQYLLQVVKDYTQKFPTYTKTALMGRIST